MLLLFFVFFLCSLFSALSFLWKSAVPDFSSGRILLHVSFNYSMCSVQYSRDIAWCCVHYIWKARWLRCLNINHVLMKRKARHGALSLILSFFVFLTVFCLLSTLPRILCTTGNFRTFLQIAEDTHSYNEPAKKIWKCDLERVQIN